MPTPRILLLLSQLPQDPASGAARSMNTICEFLATAGMEVMALATTATEAPGEHDPLQYLKAFASNIHTDPSTDNSIAGHGAILRFDSKAVRYVLLEAPTHAIDHWDDSLAARFDALFSQILRDFRPDILFTFGGLARHFAMRQQARQAGCKVVFGLRNLSYLTPGAFTDVDAILTGSEFVSRRYREVLGIHSTPLPLPLDGPDVLAAHQEKIFITYINPSIEKGAFFAARLFEELSVRRPDIPILVVESRGTAGLLVSAGLATSDSAPGFDLRRHENLMVSRSVPRPADIYAIARVIIMPSVWEEPAGRVAAEALANGLPAVVSDRGGLPEIGGAGGFVLPLPSMVHSKPTSPVSVEAVAPWLNLLQRLVDDEPFYGQACRRAAKAGQIYQSQQLIPRYADFFRAVLDRPPQSP